MSSKTDSEKEGTDKEQEKATTDKGKSKSGGASNDPPEKEEEEKQLTPEELKKRCTLLGLGRGVDITKPTPWMDKTSFQVHAVCIHDLIETDEGRLLKGYSDVVNNSTTIHSQVRAGVKAPDVPLAIGVDTEYTRTDCSSKHVVGHLPLAQCSVLHRGKPIPHLLICRGFPKTTKRNNTRIRLLVNCHGLETDTCRFRTSPQEDTCRLCRTARAPCILFLTAPPSHRLETPRV